MGKTLNHQSALVTTAASLFQRQGYHGTGLAQLLDESGSPKGSFYYHFPQGKEQLAAVAVTHAAECVRRMAAAAIDESSTPASAMRLFARRLAAWVEDNDYRAGCPITSVLLDTTPDSELTSKACLAAFESWIELWRSCFEFGGMGKAAAQELALLWVSALEGAWVLSRAQRNSVAIGNASKLISAMARCANAPASGKRR